MSKLVGYLILTFPILVFAQLSNQLVNAEGPTAGLGMIASVTAWIAAHSGVAGGGGLIVLEVLARLWPSNKIRSILSYAGLLVGAVGKLLFVVSDVVSKIVPDRKAPTEIK